MFSKQPCLQIFEIIYKFEFSGLLHYILCYIYICDLEACAACFTAVGNKLGIVVNNLYGVAGLGCGELEGGPESGMKNTQSCVWF
jgi:hypothetical protein